MTWVREGLSIEVGGHFSNIIAMFNPILFSLSFAPRSGKALQHVVRVYTIKEKAAELFLALKVEGKHRTRMGVADSGEKPFCVTMDQSTSKIPFRALV